MKHAVFPANIADKTNLERVFFVFSCLHNGVKPPSWTPILPKLENPHNAYVAITILLSSMLYKVSSAVF